MSLAIRETQNRTIGYIYTPITTKCHEVVEKLDPSHVPGGMWNGTATLQNTLAVHLNLKMELLEDPATAFLCIYLREMEIMFTHKNGTWVFISAVFVIAKTGNGPDSLQWVCGSTFVHPYHWISLINKKKWTTDAHKTMIYLQGIMLSEEKSQSQKVLYCMIPFK